ncbi:type II secretion system protein G [Sulfuricella sp. T08]|uniref:type II secretion system protein n=1 Tax=Sulfuricella sp. T08 TaxID=1632857 RepID=UPI0006179FD1|nr:prepilin-type N-terminal cleavage/methylation domain-containing protein [Sulfuricella sp. T08]GAO36447.1 type II secretion system protein G [Sulfuricella sp. T08]
MAFPTKTGKIHFSRDRGGFTLIELLVVMAIIATLLSIATPRYFHSIEKSKEVVLRQNLNTMRDALDKYYGDTGKYPATLDDLVTKKYIRSIPEDPVAGSTASWLTIAPDNSTKGGVYDVKSGALGNARNGTPYSEW